VSKVRQQIQQIERLRQKATYLGTASFVPSLSFLSYAELGVSEAEWMALIEPVLRVLAEKGEKTIQRLRVEIGAAIERGEHL